MLLSRSHLSAPAFHPLAMAKGAAKVPFLSHCFPVLATFLSLPHLLSRPCGCSCLICHQSFGCILPWTCRNAISISHPPPFQTKSFSTFSFLPLRLNMPDLFIHLLHSLSKLFVVTSEGSLGWVCWDCACDPCIVCQSTPVHQHIWRLCALKEHLKMSPAIKDSSS